VFLAHLVHGSSRCRLLGAPGAELGHGGDDAVGGIDLDLGDDAAGALDGGVRGLVGAGDGGVGAAAEGDDRALGGLEAGLQFKDGAGG